MDKLVEIWLTCTLNTPQIGALEADLACWKISLMLLKSPVTSLIFGDFWRSLCADADWALRVRARISNGAFALTSALMTAPPCLPVAPVIRSAREAIVGDYGMESG
jgi:hypothetical protein